ncbi:glycine cleavage system aminomethyltransferase GcvT [Candidatus Pelagibacter sp.]|nr:glycine cleavage system aminomethyltransferase GcvT [Candidatus Pelagibacter sp.]
MIKKTPLYNLHIQHGAKIVEFAGYQMPIQYKRGIIQEHKFTRENAGIFDVSHMGQLFITGSDQLTDDLEKIFPVNLKNLNINQSKYSFLMNERGGIYDDLIITKLKDGYLIILNAACKKQDFEIIKKKLDDKYELNLDESLSLIAIQGPKAKDVLGKVVSNITNLKFMNGGEFEYDNSNIYITRSGYTGEDGFEISLENKKVEKFVDQLINYGAKLIGLGARDTLRLEAGLCLYGNDLDEKTSPIEANLKWAIPKSRVGSDYPGSDIIKKQIDNGVKTLRVGIKPETRVIARGNTKIFDQNDKEIGKVTSGTFGPSVECSIAMGYVENNYSPTNTKIFLEVRGKKVPANVCDLPFYKKNYVKGEKNV